MPPKRKAPAKKTAAKKAKKTAEPEETGVKAAIKTLKEASKKKKNHKVDEHCILSNVEVYDDYNCMLNQTNIGFNNNKYYMIQVLKDTNGKFYAWNRWGRVGETGANALKGPFGTADKAVSDFEKKFKDKTKNSWDNRESFTPVKGKYTLIEMADDDDDDEEDKTTSVVKVGDKKTIQKVKPCSLDKPTQSLLKLIFDNNMFRDTMKTFDIDVKKMPLGKLSKAQIAKGYECLEEVEDAIKLNQRHKLNDLSSRFYTLIPHDFGRQRPPPISTLEQVQKKYDMLSVLGDIELAQAVQKEKEAKMEKETAEEVPHPLDADYSVLGSKLKYVEPKSDIAKAIHKYCEATKQRNVHIDDIFEVDRQGEDKIFSSHKDIKNRKLLWHGTSVAVVAAILNSGLRIMPHSGGRVGRGIYFASENGKSAWYVGTSGKTGIMFLNEVALGKEQHIKRDDSSLKAAPKGYDCVIAKGRTEPDPKQDTVIKIDGNDVVVPQGKPITQSGFTDSNFSESEYLIYKESQCRIRYLLKMTFS